MRCANPPPPPPAADYHRLAGVELWLTELMLQPVGGTGSSAGVQARKEDAGEGTEEEEKARQGGKGDT